MLTPHDADPFVFKALDDLEEPARSVTVPATQTKLRRAQSLVGSSPGKPENDFYPTPPDAIHALLDRENFDGSIWEPCCGEGHICKVLQERGYQDILSTDLIDRGYGEGNHDFLTSTYSADNIITNPPFSLAQPFIEKSLATTKKKVAILAKLQILEGVKRKKMFETSPFRSLYVFSKRVSFYRNGEKGSYSSSMIAFCWLVFEHGHEGPPDIRWI